MKYIEVIGLGAGNIDQLPLGMYRKLMQSNQRLYVRTAAHPVLEELQAEGLEYRSFDHLYEEEEDFATVYEKIVASLLTAVHEHGSILYAVPGHPMLAESTVQALLQQSEVDIRILGGHSYLDDLFTALQIDPIDGFQFIDATSFRRRDINYEQHVVFCQVYDAFVASELKLSLMEDLPYDYEVIVVEAVGTDQERLLRLPLEDLDREMELSNLTTVYLPPVQDSALLRHQFSQLREVIERLRGPGGCPWDQRQTHESLRPYALEEVYELLDAIDRQDDDAIVEELGDVLLQVMLHSQIGADAGYFSIDDVIRSIVNKMIHRHPHIFKESDPTKSWDELKAEERPDQLDAALLDSVVMSAPALQVAESLQKKAAKVGFDWDELGPVWDKLKEEIAEFHQALAKESPTEQVEEFGDILFVMANLARFYGFHPELALQAANKKFKSRFTAMEKMAKEEALKLEDLSIDQWESLWQRAKKEEDSDALR